MPTKHTPLPLRILYGIENSLLVGALSTMIVLSFGQIVLRNFFSVSIPWIDPLQRFLVLWIGLLGAMVATRDDNHITIDVVSFFLSARARAAVRVLTDLFAAGVSLVLAWAAVRFLQQEMTGGMNAFGNVPTWVAELILPIAFAVIGLRYTYFFGLHLFEAVRGVPTKPAAEDDQ